MFPFGEMLISYLFVVSMGESPVILKKIKFKLRLREKKGHIYFENQATINIGYKDYHDYYVIRDDMLENLLTAVDKLLTENTKLKELLLEVLDKARDLASELKYYRLKYYMLLSLVSKIYSSQSVPFYDLFKILKLNMSILSAEAIGKNIYDFEDEDELEFVRLKCYYEDKK